jgi:23S rRNA (guanosine2251-2'-O)-methyltransferase
MKPHHSAQHVWLYGIHACKMALENPRRQIISILMTNEGISDKVFDKSNGGKYQSKVKITDRERLESLLPPGAVHQGIAIQVAPLPHLSIHDLNANSALNQRVVVLDQVNDPHNVGAILRSAAVFGASAVILTDRNAPPETGVLAKSASGALELIPLIRVTNLANALKELKGIGFWCVGFAEGGNQSLGQVDLKGKIALVMGAEGDGMRRLTKELCDFNVYLPVAATFSTLNVSNAAAIALYETFKAQQVQ